MAIDSALGSLLVSVGLLALLVLGGPVPLLAQGTPLVLELPVSARAASMGGGYTLSGPLPDVLFRSPGAVSDARGASVVGTDFGPNARSFSAAGAVAWWGGAVAVGVQTLSYSVDSEDPTLLPPLQSSLGTDQPTPLSETAVSLAYGRNLFGFDFGATVKLLDARLGAARSGTVALDAGAAAELGPVRLAVSVQNLGEGLEFPLGELDLPLRVGANASAGLPSLGPLDLGAAVNAFRLGNGGSDVGGGLEVRYWPISGRTFAARVGYRHLSDDADLQGVTLGAGFLGDQIRIDYAWQDGGLAGAVHRLGVGWR